MIVVHRGFDGLDLSFKGHIGSELVERLKSAKAEAGRSKSEVSLKFGGAVMLVAETGAPGGYAYRVSTGLRGATWFFKEPNERDPWGIRVSCNSFGLALYGLDGTREALAEFLDAIGVEMGSDSVSIGRVDFAVDILAPAFSLEQENFVMHSQARRKDHIEGMDLVVHGRSGRTTSVTVGKMPGAQVIVYDKRLEVLEKKKHGPWFEIWNGNLEAHGHPPMDFSDSKAGRVWRFELRAGKKHLWQRWRIRSWEDLEERLGDVFLTQINAVRYCEPSPDTNRSRWSDAPIWTFLKEQVSGSLHQYRSDIDPDLVKSIYLSEHRDGILSQIAGLTVNLAALEECEPGRLDQFSSIIGLRVGALLRSRKTHYRRKFSEVQARYEVV